MIKLITLLFSITIFLSCNNDSVEETAIKLIQEKIGNQLPFNDVKIANIENGTAVIIDRHWCYWIDKNYKIYCVNGVSKTIYKVNNSECENAPIKVTFSDIEKIAK